MNLWNGEFPEFALPPDCEEVRKKIIEDYYLMMTRTAQIKVEESMTKKETDMFASEIRKQHESGKISMSEAAIAADVICSVSRELNSRFMEREFMMKCGFECNQPKMASPVYQRAMVDQLNELLRPRNLGTHPATPTVPGNAMQGIWPAGIDEWTPDQETPDQDAGTAQNAQPAPF